CSVRGSSTLEWKYDAVTRSNDSSVTQAERSWLTQVTASAAPASRAFSIPHAIAVAEMSTAVTCHPCFANHTASPPSPQPRSRAEPFTGTRRAAATSAVAGLTRPDQRWELSAY